MAGTSAVGRFQTHLRMRRDLLQFLLDTVNRCGDIARIDLGFRQAYLLAQPDYIKYTLQEHRTNFCRGPTTHWLKSTWGEGLTISDGALWERQRKLVQPAFHHKRIMALADAIAGETEVMLDQWNHSSRRAEQPLDMAAEMRELTTRTLLDAMFDRQARNDRKEISRCIDVLVGDTNDNMSFPAHSLYRVLVPRTLLRLHAVRSLNRIVYRVISEMRHAPEDAGMVSMLLLARDKETGEGMDDNQARAEVMSLFMAGRESTSNALSWAWYLLAKNPHVERKLKAELDTVLGGRRPALTDLPRLSYTKMVIEESLRLYPPAYKFTRQVIEDDEIGGHRIPAGSLVILSPWVTHRWSHLWENPDVFDPERFSPERSEGRPRFAYYPFGAGPRACIGSEFAMLQAQLVVATVAQRYRLSLIDGQEVEPRPALTLQPRKGLMVVANRQ